MRGTALEPIGACRTGLSLRGAPRRRRYFRVSGHGMVFLGFGKYVRADRIYALEPITGGDRGSGRRTLVWVEGIPEPIVASRTQETILEEIEAVAEPAVGSSAPAAARRASTRSSSQRMTSRARRRERPRRGARGLIGWTLLLDGVGGRIVEVEAYPAGRSRESFLPGRRPARGHVRAARSPLRLSLVRDPLVRQRRLRAGGTGAAVLLRALEPTHGLDLMRAAGASRPPSPVLRPGRLTQALDVTGASNGADLSAAPFVLAPPSTVPSVEQTPRIGITRATELPWRYVEAGTSWSSRARRAA